MKQLAIFLLVLFILNTVKGQIKMKPLHQLIIKESDTWSLIKKQIQEAKNVVTILPKDPSKADSNLFEAQVTTNSPMGAIIYETGGILIDYGWIRILGSGGNRFISRSLIEWNKEKAFFHSGEPPSFLLIADDAIGGLYAINAGGIDTSGIGNVFYFAPDNMRWENLQKSYSGFLEFCFEGNINEFYKGFRWTTWKKDILRLNGDSIFHFFPFLWSKEGQKNINKNKKTILPIQDIWKIYFDK